MASKLDPRPELDPGPALEQLTGEVVLVPMANPVGVGQWLLRGWQHVTKLFGK